LDGLPPHRDIEHEIKTTGEIPKRQSPFRLSFAEQEELSKQLEDLLQRGYISPSKSPYGATVLFVRKKDGSLRMCIDYRALNRVTVRDNYGLPHLQELLDHAGRSSIFSVLDCTMMYHQFRIKPEDRHKTAFTTRYGLFEYNVMPFGLCNAPATA
jgi:Reverse transcriptase (RNA-dependent DNA polymerase)